MSYNMQRFSWLLIVFVVLLGLIGCTDDGDNSSPTSPTDVSLKRGLASTSATSTLPDGYYGIFDVDSLQTNLPEAFAVDDGGMAVPATSGEGYLCFGQYSKGYPLIPLKAVFSVLIDNNTADDNDILILDVYDHNSGEVLATRTVSRKDFPEAKAYTLFDLDFVPPNAEASLEFRIYYLGWAYVAAHKIAVINPSMVEVESVMRMYAQSSTTWPNGSSSSDGNGYITITPSTTSNPTSNPTPNPTVQPTSSFDDSGFCTGNEIICLPEMTEANVAKYNGHLYGGYYQNGQFVSTSTGGIVIPLTLNVGRSYSIEFEIEGNIANVYGGEHNGGKVSLVTISGRGSNYYMSLQRMYYHYRGGGVFRVMLADRSDILGGGTAFLITHSSLAGGYSMTNWGSEAHDFNLGISGNSCQLQIDDFVSASATASYGISGSRSVELVIGNRESSRINAGQGAETRFSKFKLSYN